MFDTRVSFKIKNIRVIEKGQLVENRVRFVFKGLLIRLYDNSSEYPS